MNVCAYIICFHLKVAMGGSHHSLYCTGEDTHYSERFMKKLPEVTEFMNG